MYEKMLLLQNAQKIILLYPKPGRESEETIRM